MLCPYCKEIIQKDAILCKSCGKDLTLYTPLIEKIENLESKDNEILELLNKIEIPQNTSYFQPNFLLMFVFMISLSIAIQYYYWEYEITSVFYINYLPVMVLGFWVGRYFFYKNSTTYLLIGYISGIIVSFARYKLYIFKFEELPYFTVRQIIYVLGPLCVFAFFPFALIGRWSAKNYRSKVLLKTYNNFVTEESHFLIKNLDKILSILTALVSLLYILNTVGQ